MINIKTNILLNFEKSKITLAEAKKAIEIFDYIHSVDSQKLADVLSKSQNEFSEWKPPLQPFITGNICKY